MVGNALGITSEQLDKFFDTKDYTYLLPVEEPTEPKEETTPTTDENLDVESNEDETNK